MGISSITRSNTDTNQLNMNTAIILLALVSCAVASYAPAAYHGPYHIPTVTADGFLLDEPAVAAAKANHFALYNQAAHAAAAAPDYDVHHAYAPVHHAVAHHAVAHHAPAHYAYGAHHGYAAAGAYVPADTPAVAHAKAEHFAAHAKALAAAH